MKRAFTGVYWLLFLVVVFLLPGDLFPAEKLIGARFPALSPDGSRMAFSYLGDIWIASLEGGRAYRLTDHEAYDRQPVWSPDGKYIAFTSNRFGNNDVFLISVNGGEAVQLTFHSSSDVATDFTPDGKWIVFQSGRSSMSSLFKISVNGGNPEPLLDTYWSWPYSARVSPDGKTLVFSLGMENGYWWRRGYRGSNSAKLWLKDLQSNKVKMLFGDRSNAFWPAWSADGTSVYFVSDRGGKTKNIWRIDASGGNPTKVTAFQEWDVTWMSVARKAPIAVYERNFGLWATDLRSGKSWEIQLEVPSELKSHDFVWEKNERVSEFQLSPDGKKIAAVVRGEIFVLSTRGGYARNVTQSPWRERQVIWDSDSKHLIYVSDVDANPDLYRISALGGETPVRLTKTPEDELKPSLSPDGKWVAYYYGKRQLRLMRPDGKDNRLLFEADFGGWRAGEIKWSPDSRYVAVEIFRNANQDIVAVDVQSGKTVDLANTAYDEANPLWSPNGKFVLFASNRFGHSFPEFSGKWDLYQLLLQPEKPEFDESTFEALFKKEKTEKENKAQNIQVKLRLEDLDLQTRRIANTTGDESEFVLWNKDTSTVYFVSNMDGKRHLWKTSLEKKKFGLYEPFMARVSNPRNLQQDSKGKYLYYLSNGRIARIQLNSKKTESISFNTRIKVEKTADYEQMLAELYYTLQYYYYDPNHHQVNWRELYEKFRPVLQQVREDQDFYDYANQMIGFLNSSHTGIRGPRDRSTENPSAHLGIVWKKSGNNLIVAEILRNGPLYLHRDSVKVGDQLWAIDGKRIRSDQNIWQYLNGKLDKRVFVSFKNPRDGRTVKVAVKPISSRAEQQLLLEKWIRHNREIVKERTNDQIAYIYMRAMGRGDLEKFLKELERDAVPRKGLILDLRYNFGGNVHDRVLQALTKPVYAKWQRRGLARTQQSTFGFANKPVVLLVNEVTLSDGEMTTNGFKTLKRGPIVGNTTYGWLIFTTSIRLMNGGSFRLPFWGCYTLDGKDLETIGGIKPDINVINDLTHELNGQDPQLDKAIEVILQKM